MQHLPPKAWGYRHVGCLVHATDRALSVNNEVQTTSAFGEDLDPDMAVCANLREADVFLHVTNRGTFGHLVNADDFDTSHTHNELWELVRNR